MDLSVILLNYNSKSFLRQYLKNLSDLNWPINFEVIIVDNASRDNSSKMVEEDFLGNDKYNNLNLKLIKSDKNLGHSKGNNLGIKEAKGKYILISNTDIIYLDRYDMPRMIDYLDKNTDIGVLAPKLKNPDGSVQGNSLRFYKPMTIAYRRTPLGRTEKGKKDLHRFSMYDFDHNSIKEIDWVMGAQMLIRRSYMNEIGNFDSRYFLYFSDTDVCKAMWQKKYKVIYYPGTNIIHYHKRESAKSLKIKDIFGYVTRIHIKDWFKFMKKWGFKKSYLR